MATLGGRFLFDQPIQFDGNTVLIGNENSNIVSGTSNCAIGLQATVGGGNESFGAGANVSIDGSGCVGVGSLISLATSQVVVAAGQALSVVGTLATSVVMVGNSIQLIASATPTNPVRQCYVMGSTITVDHDAAQAVIIGCSLPMAQFTTNSVIIGDNLTHSQYGANTLFGPEQSVILGTHHTIFGNTPGVLIGGYCTAYADSSNGIGIGLSVILGDATHPGNGVAIGNGATLVCTGSNCGIALGKGASAGDNEFIVGKSDNSGVLNASIHHFAVLGYNGGNINTISVRDDPADGFTGLTIVYNASGTYSNQTIRAKAVGSLVAGDVVLFIHP